MKGQTKDTALIVTANGHLLEDSILGSPGWIPPEEREVVDWMVLLRFLGWQPKIVTPEIFNESCFEEGLVKWIILTGSIGSEQKVLDQILQALQSRKILLIKKSGLPGGISGLDNSYVGSEAVEGKRLSWSQGKRQKSFTSSSTFKLQSVRFLEKSKVICTLEGQAIAVSENYGQGKIITLGFHPGAARDIDAVFGSILRDIMVYECLHPVAWYNWDNTVILRMDDPGSLEVVYNETYKNVKLTEEDWSIIGDELKKRNGSMSLGYVSGWVDDGNEQRGVLLIEGNSVLRKGGEVYPSPLVRYERKQPADETLIYDYESEFKGIQNLRKEGLVEIELHGYTHLHPDREQWWRAEDRYTNTNWYREFGPTAVDFVKATDAKQTPFSLGINGLKQWFEITPTTLICPGDAYTNDVLEEVIKSPLSFVSSYYLAVKIEHQLCWAQHICSPYLNEADAKWMTGCLPVVGYFHDFDVSINGTAWFAACLEKWEAAGAKYFIDFREVANHIEKTLGVQQTADVCRVYLNGALGDHPGKLSRIGFFDPSGCVSEIICVDESGIETKGIVLNNSTNEGRIAFSFQ